MFKETLSFQLLVGLLIVALFALARIGCAQEDAAQGLDPLTAALLVFWALPVVLVAWAGALAFSEHRRKIAPTEKDQPPAIRPVPDSNALERPEPGRSEHSAGRADPAAIEPRAGLDPPDRAQRAARSPVAVHRIALAVVLLIALSVCAERAWVQEKTGYTLPVNFLIGLTAFYFFAPALRRRAEKRKNVARRRTRRSAGRTLLIAWLLAAGAIVLFPPCVRIAVSAQGGRQAVDKTRAPLLALPQVKYGSRASLVTEANLPQLFLELLAVSALASLVAVFAIWRPRLEPPADDPAEESG